MSGSEIKHRAAATRCFCPPDICDGSFERTSVIPKKLAISFNFFSAVTIATL